MAKTITVKIEDDEDADFMLLSIEGIAVTNGIKLVVEITSPPPRTIPDELRAKMLKNGTFLSEFAHSNFMGDGLEYNHAEELLSAMSDDELCDEFSIHGHSAEIVAELRRLGKFGGEQYRSLVLEDELGEEDKNGESTGR